MTSKASKYPVASINTIQAGQSEVTEALARYAQETTENSEMHPLVYLYTRSQLSHEMKTQQVKHSEFLLDLYFLARRPLDASALLMKLSSLLHRHKISKEDHLLIPYLEFKKTVMA